MFDIEYSMPQYQPMPATTKPTTGPSRTITVSRSITIGADPDLVWDLVEDYGNDHRWRAGVLVMDPSPPGRPAVGTEVREELRRFGSTWTSRSTVTEVGPGSRYRFEGRGDSGPVSGARTVTALDDGRARFTYEVALGLSGPTALVAPLLEWFVDRGLRRDLARLHRLIENGAAPAPPAA